MKYTLRAEDLYAGLTVVIQRNVYTAQWFNKHFIGCKATILDINDNEDDDNFGQVNIAVHVPSGCAIPDFFLLADTTEYVVAANECDLVEIV